MGYMISGKLLLKMKKASYTVKAGDLIYLTSSMPSQWKNPGPSVAKILWIKVGSLRKPSDKLFCLKLTTYSAILSF